MKAAFHHPKSNTHRLYLLRKDGDRGLIGFFDCLRQDMTALARYLKNTIDNYLVNIVKEEESRLQQELISFQKEEKRRIAA